MEELIRTLEKYDGVDLILLPSNIECDYDDPYSVQGCSGSVKHIIKCALEFSESLIGDEEEANNLEIEFHKHEYFETPSVDLEWVDEFLENSAMNYNRDDYDYDAVDLEKYRDIINNILREVFDDCLDFSNNTLITKIKYLELKDISKEYLCY